MRSSARRAAKATHLRDSNNGGYDFVADPDLDWRETPVFWRASLAADVACFCECPEPLGKALPAIDIVQRAQHLRRASDGLYLSWEAGDQGVILAPARLHHPVAAVCPINRAMARRYEAAERLWRMTQGQACPHPARPSRHRRSQLALALRALHGRLAGASHRQVATALFGEDVVPPGAAWKTSDIRSRTIRLTNAGIRLSGGGYRALLGGGSDFAPPQIRTP